MLDTSSGQCWPYEPSSQDANPIWQRAELKLKLAYMRLRGVKASSASFLKRGRTDSVDTYGTQWGHQPRGEVPNRAQDASQRSLTGNFVNFSPSEPHQPRGEWREQQKYGSYIWGRCGCWLELLALPGATLCHFQGNTYCKSCSKTGANIYS